MRKILLFAGGLACVGLEFSASVLGGEPAAVLVISPRRPIPGPPWGKLV